MVKIYPIFIAALSLLSLGCTSHEESDDSSDSGGGGAVEVGSDVSFTSLITRVVSDDKFADADEIYVQSYTSEGEEGSAVSYSYDTQSAIFSALEPIKIVDNEMLSYIALYPDGDYQSIGNTFTFSTPTDQSSYESYNQSSLMVATVEATDSTQPQLNFRKVMSNVLFTISNNDVELDDLAVTIRFKNSASVDISTGAYTESGSATNITPYRDDKSYGAVVAPQICIVGNIAFKVVYNGDTYSWYNDAATEFKSGYRYSYIATLDTSENSLSVVLDAETDDWSIKVEIEEEEEEETEEEDETDEEVEEDVDDDVLSFNDAPTPNTTVATIYEPSSLDTYYYPITVYGNSSTTANASPTTARTATRILPYMQGFTPDYSYSNYAAKVNKYGSAITGTKFTATGRFRTEKDANGRWWIVDPEGYRHIQRGTTSINTSNATVSYLTKWLSIQAWLGSLRNDFDELGFNATGAFSSDTYSALQTYGSTNPNNPFTIAPSFGLLSSFRKSSGYVENKEYPDGSTDNDDLEAGLPYYDGWEDYCKTYIQAEIAVYESDVNVLGFFSDNELKWNGASLNILDEFLALTNTSNPAYLAAKDFMTRNNASTPTSDLREAFAGEAAAKYYSGVRKALDDLGYKILYLGTRLHGTPKQIHAVIEAAAESCDIISINYYSNWSVANQGSSSAQGVSSFVYNSWEKVEAPFLITEFYVKATDSGLPNTDGAGWLVATQLDRACWYQHFTLGLLESTHCVGWHWFRYMDDDEANKGIYNSEFEQYETLTRWMKGINYNTYDLIDFFDSVRF